jgi:hypothetical protein
MKVENLIMWFFAAAIFMLVLYGAGRSMEHQRRCETTCAPHAAITPVIDSVETCFCDEGHGLWRRVDAGTN